MLNKLTFLGKGQGDWVGMCNCLSASDVENTHQEVWGLLQDVWMVRVEKTIPGYMKVVFALESITMQNTVFLSSLAHHGWLCFDLRWASKFGCRNWRENLPAIFLTPCQPNDTWLDTKVKACLLRGWQCLIVVTLTPNYFIALSLWRISECIFDL